MGEMIVTPGEVKRNRGINRYPWNASANKHSQKRKGS